MSFLIACSHILGFFLILSAVYKSFVSQFLKRQIFFRKVITVFFQPLATATVEEAFSFVVFLTAYFVHVLARLFSGQFMTSLGSNTFTTS